MKKFIEPTPEQRRQLLNEYGVPYDRIVVRRSVVTSPLYVDRQHGRWSNQETIPGGEGLGVVALGGY